MTNKYLILSVAFCQFGAFFYGYDSGLLTSIIGYPNFISFFGLNVTLLGALGSCYYGGSFLGGIACMFLPNMIGRKKTVWLACIFAIVGAALQTGANGVPVLFTGRALGGVANGLVYAVCPLFASEMAPPEHRGKIGGLYSIYINFGYTLTEWMGLGLSYVNQGNTNWRVFLGLQLIFPFIMGGALFFLPESPRYLVMAGRHEEALIVLQRLHSHHHDETFYIREFNQIKSQLELERRERLGVKAIFRVPSYRKRALMMMFLIWGIMFTGIIPLQNYQVFLYAKLGVSPKMSLVLAGVWGTVGCVFCILGAAIFDKVGRIKCLLISLTGQITASLLATIFWARFDATGSIQMGRAVVGMMFLYLASYAFIINTFAYTYPSEISPTAIRSFIVGLCSATFNGITIMQVQVTPIAIEAISWKYYMIFVICDAFFILGVVLYFPETKGKTLEEIAALFGDKVAVNIDDSAAEKIDADLAKAAHIDAPHRSASLEDEKKGGSDSHLEHSAVPSLGH
jgi:sugar porter (SP) family MFS transporter